MQHCRLSRCCSSAPPVATAASVAPSYLKQRFSLTPSAVASATSSSHTSSLGGSTSRRHIVLRPYGALTCSTGSVNPRSPTLRVLSRRSAHLSVLAMAALPSVPTTPRDLLVVGPGVLGGTLGKLWKEAYPSSTVVGLTNTTTRHDRLQSLGIVPAIKEDMPAGRKFPYVVFSAPPSGSQDYPASVREALALWEGPAGGGSFVFTSSLSVCAADKGEEVSDDNCPMVPLGKGPSTDRLLLAEDAVLQAEGNVVRLVGLYHLNRGAHTAFLKWKEVPRWEGYMVNLCHYEDAASLSMSILEGVDNSHFKGRVFIGCDGHPISFGRMMEVCNSSELPYLQGEVAFTLPKEQGGLGKRVNNSGTLKALGGKWAPKYESFEAFVKPGATDFYTATGWV